MTDIVELLRRRKESETWYDGGYRHTEPVNPHGEEGATEIEHLRNLNKDAHAIIDRIWKFFSTPSYDDLAGRSIYDLVESAAKDAARYQYLRDHCSSHYPMTQEQPAEWSIGWEFQQSKPHEAYGSFDKWIDADIEARRERQAAIDAEDNQ